MAINKQKAIDLRLSGLSLQQVADQLGCSIDWCKRNLRGVGKQTKHSLLVKEIRRVGSKTEGITKSEVFGLVKNAYPQLSDNDVAELVSDVKKAARRGCKDVIIRPDWMSPQSPKHSVESMMSMGQEVFDFMHALAKKYRAEFNLDVGYQKSIVYELSKLSAGKNNRLMPMGLIKYGAYLEGIADTLFERHDQKKSSEGQGCIDVSEEQGKASSLYKAVNAQAVLLDENDLPY